MKKFVRMASGWVMVMVVAMAFIWPVTHVTAANKYWDDGGSDDLWSNPANWKVNVVPADGDVIYLDDNAPDEAQTIVLDTDVTVSYLYCRATGNRDYTINSINGSAITNFTHASLNFYNTGNTLRTKATVNCDISDDKAYIQVDRSTNGVFAINGRCNFTGYLSADGLGTLELGGSNSFSYVDNWDGGDIVVKHPHALGDGYFNNRGNGSTLSLATDATIEGNLTAFYTTASHLRLKDSGTNDITLTVKGRCLGYRTVILPNAGTSTGDLTIRVSYNSSHLAKWTLATNSTLVFANTLSWGSVDGNGSVDGAGSVAIEGTTNTVVTVYTTNSYTGGTTIRSGVLLIATDNRLPVAGDLVVESGARFRMNNGFSQTLGGLAGEGIVQLSYNHSPVGTMTVNGTLAPGQQRAGTLTVGWGDLVLGGSSTSLFELDSLSGTSDQVVIQDSASDLTLGGTLQIENLGGLEGGSYTLFDLSGSTISGSYSTISMPDGYTCVVNTSSGDVVLEVTAPPTGTLIILQ